METAFIVQHSYDQDSCEETKLIGIYTNQYEAEQAVERLRQQPGFRDRPDHFYIDEYELNKDHWTEGYSTMVNILVKKGNDWVACVSVLMIDGYYQMIKNNYESEEGQEFMGDDIVRCEERPYEDGISLFAVELIKKH